MAVTVNGKTKELKEENLSVDRLLREENIMHAEGIAVALNENVIPRTEWNKTFIKNNDSILIIRATQGG